MILWYACGHESLLPRFTHTRARGYRWRYAACRRRAHLSGQPRQHQALVAPAPALRFVCSQAAQGQGHQHFCCAAPHAALPTRPVPRQQLGRARRALECRPRHHPQPVDAGTRHPSPGLVAKKNSLIASERDEWARAAFRLRISEFPAADFVGIEAIGLNVDLTPPHGREPRGQRAFAKLTRTTPPNTTLIGSVRLAREG